MDKYNKLKGKHHRLTELAADQQRRITELENKLKEIQTLLKLSIDITIKQ